MRGGTTSCPRSQLERTSMETPSFLASGASPPESCKARDRVCICMEGLAMGGIFGGRVPVRCAVAYIAAAARCLEAASIQDRDAASGVLDQFLPLQRRSRFGDPDTAYAQHVG